jgi:putative transposase
MTFASYHDPDHLYFVTASICGWKRLFSEPKYADIALNSLAWMREEKQFKLYVFCLMPSHLHIIIKPDKGEIGEALQQYGSFTAHEILKQLRIDQRLDLLAFFHESKRDRRHQHSIWQDIQAKNIYTREFLIQKIEYIHNNPISKDWCLTGNRWDYKYSSACFYDQDRPAIVELDDVREWL